MHTNVLSTIVISLLLLALTSCSSSKQMACPSFGSNKMVTKKNKRHRSFHFEISGVFKNNKSQSKRFYPSYLSFKTKSLQFDAIQLRETLKPGVIRPQSIATSKKKRDFGFYLSYFVFVIPFVLREEKKDARMNGT